MKPINILFEEAIATVKARSLNFAVCGGLAVSLYRDQMRVTNDIDLLISGTSNLTQIASEIITDLGLAPNLLRKADLDGGPLFAIKRKTTEVCVIVGRIPGELDAVGLDFLLPTIPWVSDAILRAQKNGVDYGFGEVPTITVEDSIIAKLSSSQRQSGREKDLDDLRSMLRVKRELDLNYLAAQLHRFNVRIPETIVNIFPELLQWSSTTLTKKTKRQQKPGVA